MTVENMRCTLEETDTRLLLYARHAAENVVSPATPLSRRRKGSGIKHDAEVSGAQECCALFNLTEYTI